MAEANEHGIKAWFPLREGESLRYAGNGEWGIFGVSKDRIDSLRTFIRLKPQATKIRTEKATIGYTIFFMWEFRDKKKKGICK